MSNIDWSKAPEGATHFGVADHKNHWLAAWHKKIGNEWYGWLADRPDQWELTVFNTTRRHENRIMSFIERPSDEQIEAQIAEEREKAIKDMCDVMDGADDDLDCAQRLHAAGYRKITE